LTFRQEGQRADTVGSHNHDAADVNCCYQPRAPAARDSRHSFDQPKKDVSFFGMRLLRVPTGQWQQQIFHQAVGQASVRAGQEGMPAIADYGRKAIRPSTRQQMTVRACKGFQSRNTTTETARQRSKSAQGRSTIMDVLPPSRTGKTVFSSDSFLASNIPP
jgi:hypothetical protein